MQPVRILFGAGIVVLRGWRVGEARACNAIQGASEPASVLMVVRWIVARRRYRLLKDRAAGVGRGPGRSLGGLISLVQLPEAAKLANARASRKFAIRHALALNVLSADGSGPSLQTGFRADRRKDVGIRHGCPTCPIGGGRVCVQGGAILLRQRFYASYGLSALGGCKKKKKGHWPGWRGTCILLTIVPWEIVSLRDGG